MKMDLFSRFPKALRNRPENNLELAGAWGLLVERMLEEVECLLSDEESRRFHFVSIRPASDGLFIFWLLREPDGSQPAPVFLKHLGFTFEKWGDPRRTQIQSIIDRTVAESRKICMDCGAPPVPLARRKMVLCADCEKRWLGP